MSTLQEKMAKHGFESNDDYEYPVQCLLSNPVDRIRCLSVEGESNRRKTAFAMALARSFGYPHILYHDFTQRTAPSREEILPPSKDERGIQASPIDPLDEIFSEACAYSEADPTVLVLDQLQAADFREHIRIYKFLQSVRWDARDAAYFANTKHFVLFLISEQPLYHSLQKSSFRIWVKETSNRRVDYRPEEFALGPDAIEMMQALGDLFAEIGLTPTRTEYRKLLYDILHQVRTADHLRHSIYGWTEGVDRTLLFSERLRERLEHAAEVIARFVESREELPQLAVEEIVMVDPDTD